MKKKLKDLTMKAIMISIKPKWCAKIMNGKKTIEVRKNKALANAIQKVIDENGYADIYVYCKKALTRLYGVQSPFIENHFYYYADDFSEELDSNNTGFLNGKVVFGFRCHEVKEISWQIGLHELDQQPFSDFLDKCGLSYFELKDYLNKENGYAIHISDLEIFDEPKKLSEFRYATCPKTNCEYCKYNKTVEGDLYCTRKTLTKAPQNFCYMESPELDIKGGTEK